MKWSQEKADALQKLIEGGSTVKAACKKIRVDRSTFYAWRQDYPEWAAQIDTAKEMILDDVEDALYKEATGGNIVACIFILKTQGRKRGWIEKQEINLHGNLKVDGAEALTPAEEAALKAIALANK